MDSLKRLSLFFFLGLLAYMPLHTFLSTWLGTSFGFLDFAKIVKDIVLIVGFAAALFASVRQPWFKRLLNDKLIWLIVAYGVLTTVLALLKPTDQDAEVLGVVYNIRFLLFFIYGLFLAKLFDARHVKRRALQIVLAVATVVLFFGIVQYTVLPDSALSHVGYERTNGVLPAFFIDDKPDLERVMSTLRDPNSFGSYVILIIGLAGAIWLTAKRRGDRLTAGGLLILSAPCLVLTFSRSAWLGAVAAVAVLIAMSDTVRQFANKYKIRLAAGSVALLCIATLGGVFFRDSYLVQNVVFHADEATVLEDPNQLRSRFLTESVEAIADEPLGHGPGTAGLASIRNDDQGTVLNENYYLQIAYEVGIIGLILFMAVLVVVGLRLYARRADPVALGLLAGFAGLLLTNFLVHIWSSEAVAYAFWGLAGLAAAATTKR